MNPTIAVRWLIRRDMPEVTKIEAESYECLMGDEGVVQYLRSEKCIGMVAEVGHDILGFMLYELHKDSIRVVRLAVDPKHRGHGAGSAMVQRLIDKLSQQRRSEVVIEVPESALTAQVWLRKREFRHIGTQSDHYDNGESMYLMRYTLKAEEGKDDPIPMWNGVNRISGFFE